jgi:hypothetical protein
MDEYLEPSVISGLAESRALKQSKGMLGRIDGHYRSKILLFRSSIKGRFSRSGGFPGIDDHLEMKLEEA